MSAALKAAATRRIRRRAAAWRVAKEQALTLPPARSWDEAVAVAAARGIGPDKLRENMSAGLNEIRAQLRWRKREVRQTPHMRAYHAPRAVGELALLRMGLRILRESIPPTRRFEVFHMDHGSTGAFARDAAKGRRLAADLNAVERRRGDGREPWSVWDTVREVLV